MTAPWTPGQPLPKIHDDVPEMLAAAGIPAESVPALLDFDTAYFDWTRLVAKGELISAILARINLDLDLAHFQALLAIIRIRCGVNRAAADPTIGLVAEEMAIDPSRASRIVADLVARGYVLRGAAQDDGRKSVLEITPPGWQALDAFRRLKWQVLTKVFQGWEPEQIAHFARGIRAYTYGMRAALADLAAG